MFKQKYRTDNYEVNLICRYDKMYDKQNYRLSANVIETQRYQYSRCWKFANFLLLADIVLQMSELTGTYDPRGSLRGSS